MKKDESSSAKKHLKKVKNAVQKSKSWSFIERRSQKKDIRLSEGEYLRINIRPRKNFNKFKSSPISGEGVLQQIFGQDQNKQWKTQSWLISKNGAHVSSEQIVSDSKSVTKLLRALNGKVQYISGDEFILK